MDRQIGFGAEVAAQIRVTSSKSRIESWRCLAPPVPSMTSTSATRLLFAYILAVSACPAAHAQTRKSFDAWSVVCSGSATGYCTASNRIKSVSGPYRFQLNITRERAGAPLELALLTGYQHPADGTPILLQV